MVEPPNGVFGHMKTILSNFPESLQGNSNGDESFCFFSGPPRPRHNLAAKDNLAKIRLHPPYLVDQILFGVHQILLETFFV